MSTKEIVVVVREYDEKPIVCDCGRPVRQLYWNGGELDMAECPCGIQWRGEHMETVLVKVLPGGGV